MLCQRVPGGGGDSRGKVEGMGSGDLYPNERRTGGTPITITGPVYRKRGGRGRGRGRRTDEAEEEGPEDHGLFVGEALLRGSAGGGV